jgi:tyrosyl-tRNA synthetase
MQPPRRRALAHAAVAKTHTIPQIGSATASIGDPTGRTDGRVPLTAAAVRDNAAALERGVRAFFANASAAAGPLAPLTVVDNTGWLGALGVVDFLRGPVGGARLTRMLARDAVRARLATGSATFAELAYQLLQAHDFVHLRAAHGVRLQLGGADQWSNILAGLDALRAAGARGQDAAPAYGLTVPLMADAAGAKLGKSTAGGDAPVWLDAARTPPLALFQAIRRTADADVGLRLRQLTFLSDAAVAELDARRGDCDAHRVLAHRVTALVHGGTPPRCIETPLRVR